MLQRIVDRLQPRVQTLRDASAHCCRVNILASDAMDLPALCAKCQVRPGVRVPSTTRAGARRARRLCSASRSPSQLPLLLLAHHDPEANAPVRSV